MKYNLVMQDTSLKDKAKNLASKAMLTGGAVITAAAMPLTVFAEESNNSTAVTAVTSAANTVKTDALSMINSIVPIAGGVIAAVLVVSIGFKLIRKFMKG